MIIQFRDEPKGVKIQNTYSFLLKVKITFNIGYPEKNTLLYLKE